MQRYVGQGASNITNLFEDARNYVEKNNESAIVFIDEIDALANTNGESREEYRAAVQQLWIELDKIKTEQRITFIGVTNKYNRLDNTFLDRFGSNKIEILLPDKKTRREVLIYYKKLRTGTIWYPNLLEKMVKKTNGLNIRNLEDLIEDAQMNAELTNHNIITEEILLKSLETIKLKAKEEISWSEAAYEAAVVMDATARTIQTGYMLVKIAQHLFGSK